MSDNLYQPSPSSVNQVPVTVTSTDPLAFLQVNLGEWLYWLNIFTLAWCIFYSAILIGNFYYYWVNFADGEVVNEKKGAKAISDAAWMWWSYLSAVIIYIIFKNTSAEYAAIVGWFGVAFYVCKIFVFDLPDIPFLSKIMGKPGDFITKSVEDSISGFAKGFVEFTNSLFGISSTPPPAKK